MKAIILLGLLVAEVALFAAMGDVTLEASYWRSLVVPYAPILFLAFGMSIVIATAGIDLSVGSMTALVACILAAGGAEGGAFWATGAPLGLIAGLGLGALNGLLIARLDMPPIIATLGTMILYRGLSWVVAGDAQMAPFPDVPGYGWLRSPIVVGALLALVYLVAGIWFQRSRWRREVLLLGGNRVAARYAAIRVERRIVEVYALVGLLSFLAALAYTGQNNSVGARSLEGLELQVIVAVVLGGTRIEGGSCSILGTILGAAIIAVLDEGLRGINMTRWGREHLPFEISHLRYLALGVLLAGGVWVNSRLGRAGGR